MKTYNDFKPETLSLLNRLIAAGFAIVKADDGEEIYPFSTVDECVNHLTAVDESSLVVTKGDKKGRLFLVFGNSPGELVCDWTSFDSLDEVCNGHFLEWDGKLQPTITE